MACAGPGRCVRHTTNWFRYQYTAPVTRACTRLRLLPRPSHQSQRVVQVDLAVDPRPRRARSFIDGFGNCVVEVEHDRLAAHLEVTAEICVDAGSHGAAVAEPLTPAEVVEAHALYLTATRPLRREFPVDEPLAWECMRYVFREMRYRPGTTGIATPASDAFARREGVCQDFAQVMLALCRAAGLPARYVSGHMEGEGHMHAWVEALYPPAAGEGLAWHALDPTHDRAVDDSYVTNGVGRDFADISPIGGWCYGPAPGRLTAQQQTRKTRV
jgi:transglutaminase-like putative cysteine protease